MKTTTVTRYIRPKKPNLYYSENFTHTGSAAMSGQGLNSFMAADEYDTNLSYIKWRAIKNGITGSTQMRIVIYAAKNPSTNLNVNLTNPIDPQTFRVFYDVVTSPDEAGNNMQQGFTKLKSMLTEANSSDITKGLLRMGIYCTENVQVGYTIAYTAKV